MTNYIKKMSGKQYCERIKKNPTAIITTGACEIYGPQLPMGSDLMAAQAIAERVAERQHWNHFHVRLRFRGRFWKSISSGWLRS